MFLVASFGVYLTQPLVFQVIPGYLEASGLPRAWVSTAMTLGQTTEIAMLAALPWLLRRFGLKATLMLGIFAWFARFLSLSLGPPLWLAVAGTLVHGVGYLVLHRRWASLHGWTGPPRSPGQRPGPARWWPLPGSRRSWETCSRARSWAGHAMMMFWCS